MNRPPADTPPDDWSGDDNDTARETALPVSSGLDLSDDANAIVLPENLKIGAEVIGNFVKTLPGRPGVYRMFDVQGGVLYVGKAKNLKARVAAYARGQAHTNRVARMIAETAAMEFITTATEMEALLLEANLIKQLRPRYNVLLRDDKSFPYILVSGDHAAPQLAKHRGARTRKGDYYGPFAGVGAVNRTVSALQRAFLIRTCSDSYYENRTRPCLLFQIKRCAGPCTGEIAHTDYAELVQQARDFLSGRSSLIKTRLAADMQSASEALEFERAARYRDRLAALSAIQSTQDINTRSVEEADVFAIDEQAGQFCVEVFFFRSFQNWGNRAYFPKADRTLSPAEVLGSFLAQFYDDKPTPRLVLTSHPVEDVDLLADALSLTAERKVEIIAPKRGEKADLVAAALRNAKEALSRRLADAASQDKLLTALGHAFGMERPPQRVEVYDNSHISGSNAVGAMIVAGPSGLMKTHYRTFNIKGPDISAGDDYAMMREVLTRRFSRLAKESSAQPPSPSPRERGEGRGEGQSTDGQDGEERDDEELVPSGAPLETPLSEPFDHVTPAPHPNPLPAGGERELLADPDAFPSKPDLVLVDGGSGQLSAARAVFNDLGIRNVTLVGIAKGRDRDAGRETFFMTGRAPFKLPPRDPALYFVQRLRDEAHRFAIGTHRAKRKRDLTRNPLDEIAGIGPSRKRALLLHFGTAKAVSRASLDDLMRTPGVNAATAKTVYDFFRG